ncbi:MAG: hypothetical protein ACOCXT_01645 [Candidatus Dojkabacteria bacterium]
MTKVVKNTVFLYPLTSNSYELLNDTASEKPVPTEEIEVSIHQHTTIHPKVHCENNAR